MSKTQARQVRHCIAKRRIHYSLTRLNDGQVNFSPGDSIYVQLDDFPRLLRQKKVAPIEEEATEILINVEDYDDVFPKRGPRVWLFGDGPTGPAAKAHIKPDDVVIAVNHCFWQPLSLVPDYYVALDDGMMLKETARIKELAALRKFTNRTNSESGQWDWPELRFFDVRGELGFSLELMEVYHGKTSCFVALQLAAQCGYEHKDSGELTIFLAGIDLAVLPAKSDDSKVKVMTHHYGQGNYQEELFPRMLASIRYGLSYLNDIGVKWVNYSPLLASRIEDLAHGNR